MSNQDLTQRIHEDAQITRPDQIIPGRTYIAKYESKPGKRLEVAEHTITGVSFEKQEFYTALIINPKMTNIHSMSNYGLVARADGSWNTDTWLTLKK